MNKNETTNRFKLARTAHNQHGKQSANDVKEATGISASLINDIEAEDPAKIRGVSYLVVKKLAQHYGVSSDYLLGLTDVPRKGMTIREIVAIDEIVDALDSASKRLKDVVAKEEHKCTQN